MLPRVPVICPKAELATLAFGLPQFGWFGKLNASNRNCKLVAFAEEVEVLQRREVPPDDAGRFSVLRPTLPCVPGWLMTNAAVLKKRCGSCSPRGRAGVHGRSHSGGRRWRRYWTCPGRWSPSPGSRSAASRWSRPAIRRRWRSTTDSRCRTCGLCRTAAPTGGWSRSDARLS